MKSLPAPQNHVLFWLETVEVAEGFSISAPQLLSGQYPEQSSGDELTHHRQTRQIKPDDLFGKQQLDSSQGAPVAVSDPSGGCCLKSFFEISLKRFDRSQIPPGFEGHAVHFNVVEAAPFRQLHRHERFPGTRTPNYCDLLYHDCNSLIQAKF